MKISLGVLAAIVFAAISYAAPVAVSCQGAMPVYTNGGFSGSCLGLPDIEKGNYGNGQPASNVRLSLSITHDLISGWYTMFEHADTFVYEGQPQCAGCSLGPGSAAFGAINYFQGFNSGGIVRPGFLEIDGVSGGPLRSYNGNQTLTMGFPNGSLAGLPRDLATQSYCDSVQSYCGPSRLYFEQLYQYPIPILLGTNMTLIAQSQLYDYVDPGSGLSSGYSDVTFKFRLSEANGAAVTLIPTPEPTTWGCVGLALLMASIAGCSRRERPRLNGMLSLY